MFEKIQQAKRIVIKLGTQVVMQNDGTLAQTRLEQLAAYCAQLAAQDREILVVSSGAVGLGLPLLNLKRHLSLTEKQACAAVGQSLLVNAYRQFFDRHGMITAQVLLTASDFSDRQRYLKLRDTLEKLLELKVIPIINENDTVSTMELEEDTRTNSFGDNDKLSALLASKLDADLLIILTNVDGIYTDNPAENPDAELIRVIEGFEQLNHISLSGQSTFGRGGMSSKVEAARIAAISGVNTMIVSGQRENILEAVFTQADCPGTLVLAKAPLQSRKRWLGLASGYNGIIIVNDGAKQALLEWNASLLPIGIVQVRGDFKPKQVVSIQDEHGLEVGRGLINFSSDDTRKIQGRQSSEIQNVLGPEVHEDVVIHRDNLVIFQEQEA